MGREVPLLLENEFHCLFDVHLGILRAVASCCWVLYFLFLAPCFLSLLSRKSSKTSEPRYVARPPSSFSIRRRRLYFARRSERVMAPTLIWEAPVATARSAKESSSVSPDRALTTVRYPPRLARSITSKVSLSVPT